MRDFATICSLPHSYMPHRPPLPSTDSEIEILHNWYYHLCSLQGTNFALGYAQCTYFWY